MTLNSTAEWKAQGDDWMLERMRDVAAPGTLEECLSDEGWASIYYFFSKSEYNTENVDFLAKVDQFNRTGDMNLAKQIYDEHVREGAPAQVNLAGSNRSPLDEIFAGQDEPVGPPNLFDGARDEIYRMTNADSYERFKRTAAQVQTDLAAEIDWDDVAGRERA